VRDPNTNANCYGYNFRDTFGDPDVRAVSRTDNNTLRLE
jgi:hypothetical protein